MKNKDSTKKVDSLKKEVATGKWESALSAADELVRIGDKGGIDFLVEQLDSTEPRTRDASALALRSKKSKRVAAALLSAIFKIENAGNNGTLVYALEGMDCSRNLVEVFKIMFYGSYESQLGAYNILNRQIFEFSIDDLQEIRKMWVDYETSFNVGEANHGDEVRSMLQDAYVGFMDYCK